MPVEVISYLLSESDRERKLQSQLVLQCAPFLKGIKASAITNLPAHDGKMLKKLLAGTGISYKVLAVRKDRCLVFLYRKVSFERHISRRENVDFLADFGYREGSAEKLLERLADRIGMYAGQETVFPHEIGVFLDYPLADVEGFIRNDGKDYLLSGYWKVYHDPDRAQALFRAYDHARDCAVRELLQGRKMREIAVQAA